ncbi:D-alanyl-D-alanine carboxypeptidase/D-alanyl-D-alanine endopeptidase [Desertivirga xinjiangensis]|uniref:D-alanyl-D-alanine carboxypeptidase/D-alanyl-D-alanine endopeptidase n=1 Tax=Desertivirga xinjiangensis TaxID=539206 RepID=UPI002108FE66|nr:D-alanyl-D-alanine carboxypeptidase/D-alanyl-D-alanine-endopeptidase [Pedobacter xinjiangensis]
MKFHLLYIFFFASTSGLFSQSLTQKITKAYAVFEQDAQLRYGLSSLTVLNSKTGEVLFSKNADMGLAPASTLKTITSATAYQILGKEFRWETALGYTGSITNGVLRGDLILKGSGDPTLGSNRYSQSKPDVLLAKWVNALKTAGIKKIDGRVIVDDSLFGTQTVPLGWIWQDIGNYYGAGATSASWRENEFGLVFKAGNEPGDKTQLIRTEPAIANLTIINEVTTGKAGSGDNVYAYSSPYSDIVYLRGTYGLDLQKTIKASIPDPALVLASELQGYLQMSGIPSQNKASTARQINAQGQKSPQALKIISLYQSPSLSQVVYWLNQKSLNLYAENLLKTLALNQGKDAGFEEGVQVIKEYWASKGIDHNSLNVLDGSGLSPENRITTKTMAKILQLVKSEPWFGSFYESLPLYNNMKMKSGSIRNVLCYTGYEESKQGTPLVFTFITNNYNGSTSDIKQKMFKVLDSLK